MAELTKKQLKELRELYKVREREGKPEHRLRVAEVTVWIMGDTPLIATNPRVRGCCLPLKK